MLYAVERNDHSALRSIPTTADYEILIRQESRLKRLLCVFSSFGSGLVLSMLCVGLQWILSVRIANRNRYGEPIQSRELVIQIRPDHFQDSSPDSALPIT